MAGDPFDACAHCGDSFEREVTYPVETAEGPDGTLHLFSFCDEVCRGAWDDEGGGSDARRPE